MISAFFTGVVVAIPTSLVMMKLLNSSLFINNSELADMNQKISVIITQLDDYREEREKNSLMYQMIPNKSSQNRPTTALKFDSGMIVTPKAKNQVQM